MDRTSFVLGWIAVSLAFAGPAVAHAKPNPPGNRISVQKARGAARSAYAGKITGEELEFEGGRWIYSFDMKKPSDQDIHEVHIDAISGKVLDVHTESASDEQKEVLKSHPPLVLPGQAGHFDFMETDAKNERILAAHKGTMTLSVVDLKTGKLLAEVLVGHAQGVAVDTHSDTYILGDADEKKVVFVDARSLKKTGELPVSGPVDAVAFDSKNGMAYADEDDGSRVWVIDVKNRRLASTIEIPGVPEFVAYDPMTNRVYQNIKTKDSVVVINPASNKIEAEWPTAPATGPHGLALDGKSGRMFIAGHNGKLVMIELKSGKVVSHADIAPGTDQIAFDSKTDTIYCASKGFISVVKAADTGLQVIGNIPDHKGAHTLAVDSKRESVWISYADRDHSYLQRLTK